MADDTKAFDQWAIVELMGHVPLAGRLTLAQIQTTMAALHGIDLHPIDELCNDDTATVEMTMPNGRTYRVTFTMEEAKRAKLDQRGGNQYGIRPGNMLVARAMTRAIDRHCPAVKLWRTTHASELTDKEIHSALDIAEWLRDGKKTWDEVRAATRLGRPSSTPTGCSGPADDETTDPSEPDPDPEP